MADSENVDVNKVFFDDVLKINDFHFSPLGVSSPPPPPAGVPQEG